MPLPVKHKPEDIQSAHEKQMKRWSGIGNVKFTAAEQAVLDDDVQPSTQESEK